MKYLCLLYVDETRSGAAEAQALPARAAGADGVRAAAALEPSAGGVLLRQRDGMASVANGPGTETKEQLCGLALIEAADLDEAIAIASRFPAARVGAVEVRPVRELVRRRRSSRRAS